MIILHVDGVLIAAKHSTEIENLIKSLKEGTEIATGRIDPSLKKFTFTDDGAIKTFLGVSVDKTHDGHHLAQTHLTSRILDAVGLDQAEESGRNTRDTPAVKLLLIKDANGQKRSLPWNYRSVVGMLNYLAGSTRPDASIAVLMVRHMLLVKSVS